MIALSEKLTHNIKPYAACRPHKMTWRSASCPCQVHTRPASDTKVSLVVAFSKVHKPSLCLIPKKPCLSQLQNTLTNRRVSLIASRQNDAAGLESYKFVTIRYGEKELMHRTLDRVYTIAFSSPRKTRRVNGHNLPIFPRHEILVEKLTC